MTAPLVAAIGERASIFFWMRAAMLPLFFAVIICTFTLARRLYSTRVAWWSVVLLSLFPPFFLKSIEYRTDNAWNALWMIALVVVLSGPPTSRRWFIAGFVLGCAFAVSLKTTLLLVTLIGSALLTRFLHRDKTPFARPALAAFAGFLIVPLPLAIYFVKAGAWSNLVYCVFTFNTFLEKTRPPMTLEHVLWPFAVSAIMLVARRYPQSDARRMFLGVTFSFFLVTLFGFWILISPRDMLPVMPLGAIFVAAAFDRFDERVIASSIAASLMIASLFYYTDRFRDRTPYFVAMVNQTLRLTRPDDLLMDVKGETIFRRRPFYYAFELVTREAIEAGIIADRVPEAIVASRCYVAQRDTRMFPQRARSFLNDNFLDLGLLRVAGDWVDPDGTFTVAVPGRYAAIAANGAAAGTLDGSPYKGAMELTAGDHKFIVANANERVAVIWAPAFERGFSPFHLQDQHVRYKGRRRHSRLFQ